MIYRIYYRLLGAQLNPGARINREAIGKTMSIQCSTLDAKIQVRKMIQWKDVSLPTEWLLEQESLNDIKNLIIEIVSPAFCKGIRIFEG